MLSRKLAIYETSADPDYSHDFGGLLQAIAPHVASIIRAEFVGLYHHQQYANHDDLFLIPDETLLTSDAHSLGLNDQSRFFGGCVPYSFVKTKAISHQLISNDAHRPLGWSKAFGERVRNVVLQGLTVFDPSDARAGAKSLLSQGPIRVKPPLGDSGRGQTVVSTFKEMESYLDSYPLEALGSQGLVLEENLLNVSTINVGHIMLDGTALSYIGRQRTVKDNTGRLVFGGSALMFVSGGWEKLGKLPLSPVFLTAIAQAVTYEKMVEREYAGFFASRRNYDVAVGKNARGAIRSGVLEASWRFGALSSGEIAAAREFRNDPTLSGIHLVVRKRYGRNIDVPVGAELLCHVDDPDLGPIVRYVLIRQRYQKRP